MSVRIQVYADFVCAHSYLAQFPLEEVANGKDIQIEWRPYELHPAPQPTLRSDEESVKKNWLLSVYPAAKRLGVPIVLPRISPQPHTHLAFEGYHFAREHQLGNEYHHRVFKAFFVEELDIGRIPVLTRVAGELGLDEREFRQALETHKYRGVQQKALAHARLEAGVSSVPTFIIDGRRLVGMQTKEILERVIGRALEAKRAAGDLRHEATL